MRELPAPTIAGATGKRTVMVEPETLMRWRDALIERRSDDALLIDELDALLADQMPRNAAEAASEALAAREGVGRAEAMVAEAAAAGERVRMFDGIEPLVPRR